MATLEQVEIRNRLAELQTTHSATTILRVPGALAGILDDAVADRRILASPSRDKRTVTKSLPKTRRASTST